MKSEFLALVIFGLIAQAIFAITTIRHAFVTIANDMSWVALLVGTGAFICVPLTLRFCAQVYREVGEAS